MFFTYTEGFFVYRREGGRGRRGRGRRGRGGVGGSGTGEG